MKLMIPFLFLIGLLTGPHLYTEWRYDRPIKLKIESSLDNANISENQSSEQAGYVIVEGAKAHFTEKELHLILNKHKKVNGNRSCYWQYKGIPNVTASALGIDRLHHFANSYLVGFKPFETKHVWVPLYTLALRKRYEFDHIQYSGLADVWQNSRQAYYFTRGDCEDHAIMLTDWLINMGLDARVVIGDYKGNGHAWVVLFMNGKEYLLEATDKKKRRSLNDFQIAPLMSGYNPLYQFNQNLFWFNSGSKFTTKYTGNHWVLKSKYVNYNNEL